MTADGGLGWGHPPLRVAVLVALERGAAAGGHVKTWERLARAALGRPSDIDLTVHFLGPADGLEELGHNVRYRTHAPVRGTASLPFLSNAPGHTDLARWHPGVAASLETCDVIHTTDGFFAFARTARGVAARRGTALVDSIHTDTPRYARVFVDRIMARAVGRRISGCLPFGRWVEGRALAMLDDHHRACDHVFVSTEAERRRVLRILPPDRVSVLVRGVDQAFFHPRHRDRTWLEQAFDIPADGVAILFVGRIDPTKNAVPLARAVGLLAGQGLPVYLICAGKGEDRDTVAALLGDRARFPGSLLSEALARLYASGDMLAFPSVMDVFANAPVEAMTSGLPVLVSAQGGMGRIMANGESGIIVSDGSDAAWADALHRLAVDPARRAAMGRAARDTAEGHFPTWDDILVRDLLPVWRRAAATAGVTTS